MSGGKSKKYTLLYQILMALLAFTVVIIMLVELNENLPISIENNLNLVDTIIWIIFVVDYLLRLALSHNKKVFIKTNIIDLISILPFNSLFQTARILRISKLLKLTRLFKILRITRLLVFLVKLKKGTDDFLKTNNFQYVLSLTILTIFSGALGLSFAEKKSISDSLWWSFVTVTTVGYGDISPTTNLGRIIAVILMLIGIGFIGMLTGTIATFFIAKKEKTRYRTDVIEDIKRRLDNFEDMSLEEIDDIFSVLKALKVLALKQENCDSVENHPSQFP